ncbi:MAG: hypothetical protein IT348_14460 [Candidatus Eisenbacteria bacterium]|nr:hypothetical protein [Candidatus Eisenbacteria bacterium]
MKLVIFGVIAFVVGIGGSTGALVMTAPKLPPGADSLLAQAADSSAAHGAAGAHGATAAAPAAGHAAPAGEHAAPAEAGPAPGGHAVTEPVAADGAAHGADATVAGHAPAIEAVRVPPAAAAGALHAASQAPDEETFKQVGSILMNMKPAEAAKIMGYLTDSQVEGLLRSMSPRNAATVLSQLPPERAAALSRRLLVPAPKEARP